MRGVSFWEVVHSDMATHGGRPCLAQTWLDLQSGDAKGTQTIDLNSADLAVGDASGCFSPSTSYVLMVKFDIMSIFEPNSLVKNFIWTDIGSCY